jgi:hypothetical protein
MSVAEDEECWFTPTDPPDPWRYRFDGVPSWALRETIWTPGWRDAYPPTPCLCSAWGGLGDVSRIGDWAGV